MNEYVLLLPFQILSDHHELWTHYLLVTHLPCNAKITISVTLQLRVKGNSTI